ncbi:transcription elongation factor NusA [Lentisphaera araneosa HTCC2155]|uniref:Transcription elongation factor NusA n=1 Tax=Lentisphaera araneosa HTCC2155 TaxID=313628 RepID=A6DKQ1_9BACT|nr:hypothetical protein [Lentisphaera araneosa]EDM27949.1 transcription elongation factor NusA [Lentisphaera araneosa HTCC2155]
MTQQDQQFQNFYAPKLSLWKLATDDIPAFADALAKLDTKQAYIAFDRYTWSELSSGQMPSQLMPSFSADFITLTESSSEFEEAIAPFAIKSECIDVSDSSKERLESSETISASEPDFNGSVYLILDEKKELTPCTEAYEFEGQVEGCFFLPSQELITELTDRVRDKESITIETGPKLRC